MIVFPLHAIGGLAGLKAAIERILGPDAVALARKDFSARDGVAGLTSFPAATNRSGKYLVGVVEGDLLVRSPSGPLHLRTVGAGHAVWWDPDEHIEYAHWYLRSETFELREVLPETAQAMLRTHASWVDEPG